MLKNIKQRIKKLGFISIELVIIGSIVLAGGFIGIDKLMKNSNGVISALDDASYEKFKATKSELTIKIIGRDHVNYLYDVGEKKLTDEDLVKVGNVDCYVLEVDEEKNAAKLISKEIYELSFDTGKHSASEVEQHTGFAGSHSGVTYDYKYSTIREWMNNDFLNGYLLNKDSILKTNVNYYLATYDITNIMKYENYVINNDKIFALDALEAYNHYRDFSCNDIVDGPTRFWTTAGYVTDDGTAVAFSIGCKNKNTYFPLSATVKHGIRPVFWISLD